MILLSENANGIRVWASSNEWVGEGGLICVFPLLLVIDEINKVTAVFLSVFIVFSHSFNLNCSSLNIFFIPSYCIDKRPQFEFSVWRISPYKYYEYVWMRCGNRQNKKNLVNFAFHFVSHETFRQVNLLKTHVIWLPKLSIFTYSILIWHHAFYSHKKSFLFVVCLFCWYGSCARYCIVARIPSLRISFRRTSVSWHMWNLSTVMVGWHKHEPFSYVSFRRCTQRAHWVRE